MNKRFHRKTEYALVNRGSRPIPGYWDTDWKYNAQQPFGNSDDSSYSLKDAKEFVENHHDANITFVGHSKGGAETLVMH